MPDSQPEYATRQYSADCKAAWDNFLNTAKNATFLFRRDYMDYHSDRFKDHSLMIYRGNDVIGLLPANLTKDGNAASHQGLTFGGMIVSREATIMDTANCFHAALRQLHEAKIPKLIYKAFPSFYNVLPDHEVAYSLFLLDAKLTRRDCAIAVLTGDRLPVQTRRERAIKKARKANIQVKQETSFAPYWERVLSPRLESRYGVKPVHSLEEITLLASRFPENIKQFSAYLGDQILAGTTIYETPTVAHAQYIAVTDEGQKMGALDFLFGTLIDEHYKSKRIFDFGNCCENEGRALNYGLMDWKEGFGGRTYVHDFYEIPTESYGKLEPVLQGRPKPQQKAPGEE